MKGLYKIEFKELKEPTPVHLLCENVNVYAIYGVTSFLIPDLEYKPDSKSLFNITTRDRGLILKLT